MRLNDKSYPRQKGQQRLGTAPSNSIVIMKGINRTQCPSSNLVGLRPKQKAVTCAHAHAKCVVGMQVQKEHAFLGVADWGVPGSRFQPPEVVLVVLGLRRTGVRFLMLDRKLRGRSPGLRLSLRVGVMEPLAGFRAWGAVTTLCRTGPITRPLEASIDFIQLSPAVWLDALRRSSSGLS